MPSATHETPRLIATVIPNFSRTSILIPQIRYHGNRASTKSMTPEYAPANTLYEMYTFVSTQTFIRPGESHVIHVMMAMIPMKMLIDTMAIQTIVRGHSLVRRSIVTPKEVLDHMAPVMAKVAARLPSRPRAAKLAGSTVEMWRPRPWRVLMDTHIESARRRSCGRKPISHHEVNVVGSSLEG